MQVLIPLDITPFEYCPPVLMAVVDAILSGDDTVIADTIDGEISELSPIDREYMEVMLAEAVTDIYDDVYIALNSPTIRELWSTNTLYCTGIASYGTNSLLTFETY